MEAFLLSQAVGGEFFYRSLDLRLVVSIVLQKAVLVVETILQCLGWSGSRADDSVDLAGYGISLWKLTHTLQK